MSGKMMLRVNDVEIHWNDEPRRVARPCVTCAKKTKGRTWGVGGLKKPSCVGCAITAGFDKVKKIYGVPK